MTNAIAFYASDVFVAERLSDHLVQVNVCEGEDYMRNVAAGRGVPSLGATSLSLIMDRKDLAKLNAAVALLDEKHLDGVEVSVAVGDVIYDVRFDRDGDCRSIYVGGQLMDGALKPHVEQEVEDRAVDARARVLKEKEARL